MEPNNRWDESPDEIEIDLRYYYYLLKSQWWLLVGMALIAGLVAFGVSSLQERVYRSTATIYVDSRRGEGNADFTDLRTSQTLAETYSELITSRAILEQTVVDLGLVDQGIGVRALQSVVTANPVGTTQLIRVSAENTNPQLAADIANTVSQALIDQIQEIETSGYSVSEDNLTIQLNYLDEQIATVERALGDLAESTDSTTIAERNRLEALLSEYNRDYSPLLQSREEVRLKKFEASSNMRLFEQAAAATNPIRPSTMLNTIVGVMLGVIVAMAYILGRELLDDTITDPERLSVKLGIPIIGRILNFDADNERLITIHKPRSPQAENFRSVRLNLDYASPDQELRSILITSAAPSEGKSTLASNLAIVMAQGGKHTMLIDGDMRRPKVHRIFDVPNMVGLSNLFLPSANGSMDSASVTAVENLSVVASGPLPPNPSELFYSRRAGEIIQNAEKSTDMVIVDTPPIAAMTDATAIARHVDGVILAVRFGQTKRRVLDQAIEALQQVDARILGMVITDVGNRGNRYGNYYYNYRYGYSGYSVYYQDEETPKETGLGSRLRRKTKVTEE